MMPSFILLGPNEMSAVSTGFMMTKGTVATTLLILSHLALISPRLLRAFPAPTMRPFAETKVQFPGGDTQMLFYWNSMLLCILIWSQVIAWNEASMLTRIHWNGPGKSIPWCRPGVLPSAVGLGMCAKLFYTNRNFSSLTKLIFRPGWLTNILPRLLCS